MFMYEGAERQAGGKKKLQNRAATVSSRVHIANN